MEKEKFLWDAKLYDENSSFQYNLALMAIEKLAPCKHEKIMDIGCGNALATIELAKRVYNGEVTAIELSKEMYGQALLNIKNHGIQNIHVKNSDILTINYDNTFDAVFSNSAVHWIRDYDLLYNKIYRSLKHNSGRIVIQTGLQEYNELFATIKQIQTVPEFKAYLTDFVFPWVFLTIDETVALLKNNSFKNISVDPLQYRVPFNNEIELINFFKAATLVPFFSVLPANVHEQFSEKFKDIFCALHSSNALELKMTRMFIRAEN